MRTLRLAFLLSAAVGTSGCSFFLGPSSRPAPTEKVETNAELVSRGDYLANHVMVCVDCHSPKDKSRFTMPPQKGAEYSGGDCYGEEAGVPGKMCMSNITPDPQTGVGGWSDGQILRAIREGVDKDDNALMPGMPYPAYREMADEDVKAIVAYLRTVPAVSKQVPDNEFGWFIRHIFNTFPEPVEAPVAAPDRSNSVKYGEYLAKMGGCRDCHSPKSGSSVDEDRLFAGGAEYKIPGVVDVRSANITPDKETGIGNMTKEQFIGRFKSFADQEASTPAVEPHRQTIMPWPLYAGMAEEDLGAIYDYLQSVKPISQKVEIYRAAAPVSEGAR
jgi:mono/diheme cytochrome c family protein